MSPAADQPASATATLDAVLVDSYPRLVRLAALVVGADAEDAVMDAFLRVRSRDRKLDRPDAYLRTAVMNECRSRWRRSARPPRYVEPVRGAGEPEIDGIWREIGKLSGQQRAVVALRFYEDLTIPQIAAALELPQGTVKSELHRAIERLRTLLPEEPT